jgi:hypothetical protein
MSLLNAGSCFLYNIMKSFEIKAEIAGKSEALVVVPQKSGGEETFRVIKDGVEFCSLKKNGEMGWEVKGTPLNAEELDSIGNQINVHTTDSQDHWQ